MSVIKKIFSKKSWATTYAKLTGSARSYFGMASRGCKSGWNYMKSGYRKNSSLYNSIAAGVSVGFISRALWHSNDAAEKSVERETQKYGESEVAVLSGSWFDSASELILLLERSSYMDKNTYAFRSLLTEIISKYHMLLSKLDVTNGDLAITTDRMMGATLRLGLKPEVSSSSDVLVSAFLRAKDEDELGMNVSSDLINMMSLASYNIPLISN